MVTLINLLQKISMLKPSCCYRDLARAYL